jgi:hypothetical protein
MLAPARHVDWDAVGHEVENDIIQPFTLPVLSALLMPLFHSRSFGHSRCPEYALSKMVRNSFVQFALSG